MKEIESIIDFPQYLRAKMMRIVIIKMVTAMPVSANAQLIMSMPKIAHIMDVSMHSKSLCSKGVCMILSLEFNGFILSHHKTIV